MHRLWVSLLRVRQSEVSDLEMERIKRQAELNHIEIGERYQQTADFENRLQEAIGDVLGFCVLNSITLFGIFGDDASIVVRDLETGKVEMVSPDAILSYEGYPAEVEVSQANVAPEAEPPAEPQPKNTTVQASSMPLPKSVSLSASLRRLSILAVSSLSRPPC